VVTELLELYNGSYGGVKKMTGFDSPLRRRFWIVGMGALVILLLGTSAYSVPGLVRERRHTQDLTASNEALTASLRQMQNQLQLVSEKLNAIAAQPAAIPLPAPRVQERPKVRAAASPRKATQAAEDARWRQMRTRLADQQKQIDTTRDETSQARKELQDNLDSTRDELSGAIAKTHDELAVLQKRGERNYYEFQIDKSKQFHAAGPLSLSLRKVNVKQGYYDIVLVVDDRRLEKKHANLYEPLMFTLADRPQPVDLVVNQIANNQVKGYVSEPKYKKADLAAASPGTTPVTNDPKALQRR
jgi:small-conductance mechanosensitive channel